MNKELESILKRFMNYSLRDIDFKYLNLTDNEKSFVTEEQFIMLCNWLQKQE